jgi:hypothetical protein
MSKYAAAGIQARRSAMGGSPHPLVGSVGPISGGRVCELHRAGPGRATFRLAGNTAISAWDSAKWMLDLRIARSQALKKM